MAKKEEMLGVEFNTDPSEPFVDSSMSPFYIPFYKTEEYFEVYENYCTFVKACENNVRRNAFYKTYIKYLTDIVGMKCCQVLPNVEVEEGPNKKVTIEMHHGPIFTLYDICDIMIDHFLRKGWEITTYDIADKVLDEHWANRIQVVMLSISVHQDVHDREIFISTDQAWGNLTEFLKRYKLSPELREKYNRYMDRCQVMDSTAYERLQLNEKIFERMDKK